MAYATQQEMIDRFGQREIIQLTDKSTPPTGSINSTVLGKAIADAEATINGYVASRYSLPLAEVPQQLIRIACDLTRFFLDKEPSKEVQDRYDYALAWLRDVSAGRVSLGVVSPQVTPSSTGGPTAVGGARVFNTDNLADY